MNALLLEQLVEVPALDQVIAGLRLDLGRQRVGELPVIAVDRSNGKQAKMDVVGKRPHNLGGELFDRLPVVALSQISKGLEP